MACLAVQRTDSGRKGRGGVMELYQLKYFAQAAKYENISMAAQELHVTQPSISKAIKALEKEMQVDLMCKVGKYSVLTHEGRILQARLIPILGELSELPKAVRSGGASRRIRLNALSAGLLVPELIHRYHEKNPNVYFNVMEQRESISWDICIRSTLPQVFFNSAVKLMTECLLVAVHKGSSLGEKECVTLDDLQDENFVMLKQGGSIRMLSDRKFKELGFIPRQAFECENFYILKRMIEEGLGVAIWPQYSWRSRLEEENAGDNICLRRLDVPDFYRSLYLIRQKDVKLTPEMEEFSDFIIQYFAQVGPPEFLSSDAKKEAPRQLKDNLFG